MTIRKQLLTALLALAFLWAGLAAPYGARAQAFADRHDIHAALHGVGKHSSGHGHGHANASEDASEIGCCHGEIACVSAYDGCVRDAVVVAVRFDPSDADWLARARRGANLAELDVRTPPPRPRAA